MDRPTHLRSSLHRSVTFSREQIRSLPVAVTGTALWTAAARARESVRPDALFSDPWAAALTSTDGRAQLVASEHASVRENPFLPVRTRFFDDLLTAATWAEQIVLLGAGMDTRAFRLNLPTDTVMFEVDHPEIFTAKNVVLDGVTPRCQRREVPADLAGEWEPALMAAGFDAARLTLWLAEGLFFYLTEDAVRRLLRTAARLCQARALFRADIFGTGLPRLPSMQPLIDQRQALTSRSPSAPTSRASSWPPADGARTLLSASASPKRTLGDYPMSP
jgi:methyltransferase (TIGR00027 family)